MSWFKQYLSRHHEHDGLYIPLYLKPASNLVGAPLGSMSHADVLQLHLDSADYKDGFVYDEAQYQSLCLDVKAAIQQASNPSRALFFP